MKTSDYEYSGLHLLHFLIQLGFGIVGRELNCYGAVLGALHTVFFGSLGRQADSVAALPELPMLIASTGACRLEHATDLTLRFVKR